MTPTVRTLYARTALRGPEHARAEADCPRCHDHRTFYAFIAPDPAHHAETRVYKMAAAWQATHPCIATYAHPRKIVRAA